MKNLKKVALQTLVDYVITLLFCIFGFLFFAWLLEKAWGGIAYSGLMCLLLFGLIYARLHRVGLRDGGLKDEKPGLWQGIKPVLPLAMGQLVLILFYWLLETDILPWGNFVIKTVYSFPDYAPRVAEHVLLSDYITPWIRFLFAPAAGLMQQATTAVVLAFVPVLILFAGFLGYLAGRKGFFFSALVFRTEKKIQDKFNE